MSYHVFVDHGVTGENLVTFCERSAYDASALANAFGDAGYSVVTDLWDATVWDAMISPAMWERYALVTWPRLVLAPYEPEAAHTCGPGVNYGCDAPGCDGDTD